MKNILLFIMLFIIQNIEASFPVTEVMNNSIFNFSNGSNSGNLYAILSVVFSLFSLLFIFLFIGNGIAQNGNPFPFLILSLFSILATIFFGIKAKTKGLKANKSYIGIITILLSILLIRYLIFV